MFMNELCVTKYLLTIFKLLETQDATLHQIIA